MAGNSITHGGGGGGGGGTAPTPSPGAPVVPAPYSSPTPEFRTPTPVSESSPVQATPMMPDMDGFVLGMRLFGTVLQSYGAYAKAEMESEALEFNAAMAMRDIEQVEKAKRRELHKSRTTERRLLAKQIATAAASGRQMSGSPLDVMARSESDARSNQNIIRSNAAVKKGQLYAQASFDLGEAKTTKQVGRFKAFSNLLIGGTESYSKSNYFKKAK